ncbi:hypothetical protein Mgra_00005184 [Meloidogyne graminicola]|uniref:Uncharacterized protein n=1 Tax=Meloidogyne graminicola TaxID=189291 RepID=A0A8S9ZQA7_9BILA|nr:hypothetical protein Mgra_00005184 [Meloidogyne graminicola]
MVFEPNCLTTKFNAISHQPLLVSVEFSTHNFKIKEKTFKKANKFTSLICSRTVSTAKELLERRRRRSTIISDFTSDLANKWE